MGVVMSSRAFQCLMWSPTSLLWQTFWNVTATLEWNVFQFSEEKLIQMSAPAPACDILSFGVSHLLEVGCNILLLRWWSLGRDEPLHFDSFPCKYCAVPVATGPAGQLVWSYVFYVCCDRKTQIQLAVMSENSNSLLFISKEPWASNTAVRQCGCQHQREPEENWSTPLQGFLAEVSRQFKGLVWKGTQLRMLNIFSSFCTFLLLS